MWSLKTCNIKKIEMKIVEIVKKEKKKDMIPCHKDKVKQKNWHHFFVLKHTARSIKIKSAKIAE